MAMTKKKQKSELDQLNETGRRKAKKERRETGGEVSLERRKVQRRRQIDPTTCERDYTDEELAFMKAMDDYKRRSGRMFPTCSEILEVLRSIGYVRLTEEQRDILGDSLDDPATSAYVSDEADEEAEFFADAE